MNRAKAIEAMDLFASQGYHTMLTASPIPPQHMIPGNEEGIIYGVSVSSLGFDKIDLRHLCDEAEKIGLDVYAGRMQNGDIAFGVQDTTPEVVSNPRKHPREVKPRKRIPPRKA